MLFSSVNQVAQTLTMIYCGIVIGIVYDAFGLLRRLAKKKNWLIHLLDVLFCAVALVIFLLFVYIANRGSLPVYIFIGVLIGLVLQFFGIKPIIKALTDTLFYRAGILKAKFKRSGLYKRIVK